MRGSGNVSFDNYFMGRMTYLYRYAVVNVKATAWLKGIAVETSMYPANSYVFRLKLFWIRALQPSASADYCALDGCHTS